MKLSLLFLNKRQELVIVLSSSLMQFAFSLTAGLVIPVQRHLESVKN